MKERLVGAAVLVALGVWLIPWVLDGRDPAPAGIPPADDTVSLPAADSPSRTQTRTIALTEPSHAPVADGTGSGETTTVTGIEAHGRPAAAVDQAANDGTSGAGPSKTPATPPATVSATAAARAGAGPAAGDDAGPAPDGADGGWFVQLGSFGEIENAKRLAGRVSTFGYSADVSTYRSGGRTLNRVRVGPSASREEAAVIASSLSAHGFVAQVVSAD